MRVEEWHENATAFYDTVASAELGEEELTYDLSVPDNVTYIANGFISHNTIGLLMDCDTTGIEPDLALKKMKKLVGGGTMAIVNQTVPRALRKLGHDDEPGRRTSSSTSTRTRTWSGPRTCVKSTSRSSTRRWASARSTTWVTSR